MNDELLIYIESHKDGLPYGFHDLKIEQLSVGKGDFIETEENSFYNGIRVGVGRFYKPILSIAADATTGEIFK
ncbi:MAG: hypothetical protein IJU72_02390 [Bacteroidales bacterium]|nr:hypothetical protein [Bacteroidales bacterium]